MTPGDTTTEQLTRGELAERQVQTLLVASAVWLLEIERLRAALEQGRINDQCILDKLDKCFHGYQRMIIVLACARSIAAMFGPAQKETREQWLEQFPNYMRSMWRYMDEIAQ